MTSPDPVLTANQRADELHDIVSTTGSAFLGLTVGCARCHDHKFDPIPTRDYYAKQGGGLNKLISVLGTVIGGRGPFGGGKGPGGGSRPETLSSGVSASDMAILLDAFTTAPGGGIPAQTAAFFNALARKAGL